MAVAAAPALACRAMTRLRCALPAAGSKQHGDSIEGSWQESWVGAGGRVFLECAMLRTIVRYGCRITALAAYEAGESTAARGSESSAATARRTMKRGAGLF
ncbi:hypothetical protein PHYPSEUDO_009226 [Phytophthora pseudosyringae]|uniref:Uncharacterized protein n=1 Tax=Phytophthora pseudosyringae TaxID=221518 RepID=A0A8T1WB77_9STRA|nr:hypothetical protein PHYPSEUDO_009226 [Phytophthora pseudosyringae]